MENQFFSNTNVPPQLHFEQSQPSSMPTWQSLPSEQQNQDCFYTTTWDKSTTDQNVHQFDSALSSMVSSPAASNSNMSNENFVIRELIGKLGNIGNCSDEISQNFVGSSSYINSNNNTSCYNTPMNSPPKLNIPKMAMNSTVAEFSTDPGFAERAAKFSCFGSRSFNGRLNNCELSQTQSQRSNPLMENGKISRVSSSPSLKALGIGSQIVVNENMNSCSQLQDQIEVNNSQEESTISEQVPNVNSRKRKVSSKGKVKETSNSTNPPMASEAVEDSNAKRNKPNESEKNENGKVKAEEESKRGTNSNDEKQNKSNSKPPEAPKDYIHVRARRGQATDSHSLAERVRREKISERMKLLQDLVPGCNKVTGKALMLDEIINYVQSLQRQVEFLSMKLASVNTRVDFNIENLISKDIFQSNNSLAHPIFQLDSSAPSFYGQQPQQNPAIHNNISNGTVTHNSMDTLESGLCQSLGIQLPSLNGFIEAGSQYPLTFSEDDLHTIVQMGFGQTDNRKTPIQFQNLNGSNQLPL